MIKVQINSKRFTRIKLLSVIAIVGILASIAIPGCEPDYRPYMKKAKVSGVVNAMGAVKNAIIAYYTETGNLNNLNFNRTQIKENLGIDVPMQYISNISVNNIGAYGVEINVVLTNIYTDIDGKNIRLSTQNIKSDKEWTWSGNIAPSYLPSPKQEQSTLTKVEQKPPEPQESPEPRKPKNWQYDESPDKMGRGVIKTAKTSSVNEISFDFPYQGPQHGTLILRTHPQHGKDVMLKIERGQFLTGIDGCKVLVRFDDGKPQSFWATEPADYSTTTIFISGYSKLIAGLKRAKKVMIEAPFFQEGNQVFEFNVEGLQWETTSSSKKKK